MVGALRITAGVAAAAALAACATTVSERVDEKALAFFETFEPTGETKTCVSLPQVREIRPISETKFLVQVNLNKYYLNEVNGRCSGATAPGTYLTYSVSIAQLCRNEIVRVVDQGGGGFTRGSCGLGTFQELKLKEAAADGEEGAEPEAEAEADAG